MMIRERYSIKLQFGDDLGRPRLPEELYNLHISIAPDCEEPEVLGTISIDTDSGEILFLNESKCFKANILSLNKYRRADCTFSGTMIDRFAGESYFDIAADIHKYDDRYFTNLYEMMVINLTAVISYLTGISANVIRLDYYTSRIFHLYVLYSIKVLVNVASCRNSRYDMSVDNARNIPTRPENVNIAMFNDMLYNAFSDLIDAKLPISENMEYVYSRIMPWKR